MVLRAATFVTACLSPSALWSCVEPPLSQLVSLLQPHGPPCSHLCHSLSLSFSLIVLRAATFVTACLSPSASWFCVQPPLSQLVSLLQPHGPPCSHLCHSLSLSFSLMVLRAATFVTACLSPSALWSCVEPPLSQIVSLLTGVAECLWTHANSIKVVYKT